MVDTNFQHRLTDLHWSKLIMTVLTFRDVSKFSSVNIYIGGIALGLYFNPRNLLQQDLYRNEIETIIYFIDLQDLLERFLLL